MSDILEAVLMLLPSDAGGRASAILPRDGSYRPYAVTSGGERLRIRVIEGPRALSPGEDGRVLAEIECDSRIDAGDELLVVETGDRCVGILAVTRRCRAASEIG